MPKMLSETASVDINRIISIAREAGKKILEVYQKEELFVEYKEDDSPLTLADKTSHLFIQEKLNKFYPDTPILSEEGEVSFNQRKDWNCFWLVDPLDGTKEFIKRNGEFTVNIALVFNKEPVLGVIYAPVKNELFYAVKGGLSAYKIDGKNKITKLAIDTKSLNDELIVVASRSHATKELEDYVEKLKFRYSKINYVSIGSSLKFCLVAENKAHLYPRFGPTMEWDTAAGQIILEEAGGEVRDVKTNSQLKYNKEDLLNPSFIAAGKFYFEKNI